MSKCNGQRCQVIYQCNNCDKKLNNRDPCVLSLIMYDSTPYRVGDHVEKRCPNSGSSQMMLLIHINKEIQREAK